MLYQGASVNECLELRHTFKERNGFVKVPRAWKETVKQDGVLKISGQTQADSQPHTLYAKCGGYISSLHIEINTHFSAMQGFKDGELVSIQCEPKDIPACQFIDVVPCDSKDLQILELNRDTLCDSLLGQMPVVWAGANMYWSVSDRVRINITIKSIYPPAECAVVARGTECRIIPQKSVAVSDDAPVAPNLLADPSVSVVWSAWSRIFGGPKTSSALDAPTALRYTPTSELLSSNLELTLRVVVNTPDRDVNEPKVAGMQGPARKSLAYQTSVCFISIESMRSVVGGVRSFINEKKPSFFARLCKLSSPGELKGVYDSNRMRQRKETSSAADRSGADSKSSEKKKNEPSYEQAEKEVFVAMVRVVVLELMNTDATSTPGVELPKADHVALSADLCLLHGLTFASRVRLVAVSHAPSAVDRLELKPLRPLPSIHVDEELRLHFASYVGSASSDKYPLVVNSKDRIRLPLKEGVCHEFGISVKHGKSGGAVQPLYSVIDSTCKISVEFLLPTPSDLNEQESYHPPDISKISSSKLRVTGPVFDDCSAYLRHGLAANIGHSRLLICGPKGCGKTSLAHSLALGMYEQPYLCCVTQIDCKKLKGRAPDVVRQELQSVVAEAVWRQPTVLLLDDLHVIARGPSGPDEESSAEVIYSSRVAEVIRDILKQLTLEGHQISVIATCQSKSSLHQRLLSANGIHFFQKTVEMQPPDRGQRADMLKSLVTVKGLPEAGDEMIVEVARKTDGFYPVDLAALVDRAFLEMQMRTKGSDNKSQLSSKDFTAALKGFTPTSLRDVPLHTASDVKWSDIGGLSSIKDTLVQMLEWPKKYPSLYANCPIRLQSGVLLFGPPGTGKTLLASAVARETGLNFISIKGPELLSKYIGASEQAVRNTFLRAQSAKPCVLFFDEFDSFAPKRGHDSTGVTDRVVNQLLTHLDGLEALTGVYVLAATSRPDLIDPALLRPGRLDKSLYCSLPNAHERLEILEALSRKLTKAEDVNLKAIADQCENFTGADLKSLLGNAQLAAVHEHIDGQKGALGDREGAFESSREQVSIGFYADALAKGEWQDVNDIKDPAKLSEVRAHLNQAQSLCNGHSGKTRAQLQVVVSQSHLQSAADRTQPSVSSADRDHYQRVYKNFMSTKGSQFSSLQHEPVKQKVTLA